MQNQTIQDRELREDTGDKSHTDDIDTIDSGDMESRESPAERIKQYRWKKGQSGNSKGRPKGAISIMGDIRHKLESDPKLRKKYVQDILEDKNLRREIIQQIDGKPREHLVISGAVEFGRMKELSTQELRALTGDEYTVLNTYDNDGKLLTEGGGGGVV